jgi:DUF438 domain-containing protein
MANTYESRQAQTLTRLLRRINEGEDPNLLRKEAHRLLTNVDPRDIATAEQNLIKDGYPVKIVQLLSATFMLMGITEEQSDNPRTSLPANHILQMVMVEHDLIRCFLGDLNDTAESIQCLSHLTDVNSEFHKLAHITEHLNAMKEHIEREDDVIFPYLRKYGRMSLCQAVQDDHTKIVSEIDKLVMLIVSFNKIRLEEFKSRLVTITGCLTAIMLEHLCQEDSILYPIALWIIDDVEIWEEIKAVCDEISYCGIHP